MCQFTRNPMTICNRVDMVQNIPYEINVYVNNLCTFTPCFNKMLFDGPIYIYISNSYFGQIFLVRCTVFTLFRQIQNQSEFRLLINLSENGNLSEKKSFRKRFRKDFSVCRIHETELIIFLYYYYFIINRFFFLMLERKSLLLVQ